MTREQEIKFQSLFVTVEKLYCDSEIELLFHGWHHISFVTQQARDLAIIIGADAFIVASAGLTHDLNYLVAVNSEPEDGRELRIEKLSDAGYTSKEIEQIETVIIESHTANRSEIISKEGKALSDADTLFKSLPTTPILFASKYIQQNKVDIQKLAKKILQEQKPLFEKGIYFYTEEFNNKYLDWAKTNLQLWENVLMSLNNSSVKEMLDLAKENGAV